MGTADFEEDDQRPLSERGHEKMKNIACSLKTLGVKPDLIVSSPYVRAVQTAQILKKVLECKLTHFYCIGQDPRFHIWSWRKTITYR
jgi:phosphohistidine phosphatase